ncbi:MAG: hypothetical protein IID05_10940 [Gemmatimonadetes bacterium]|nr:hypothetical protein [Gemmatimonadota bacterium]
MSYSTHEPLSEIISELKAKLPALQKMLHDGVEIQTLHGTVEMLSSLIARYDRGEIVEKKQDQ